MKFRLVGFDAPYRGAWGGWRGSRPAPLVEQLDGRSAPCIWPPAGEPESLHLTPPAPAGAHLNAQYLFSSEDVFRRDCCTPRATQADAGVEDGQPG